MIKIGETIILLPGELIYEVCDAPEIAKASNIIQIEKDKKTKHEVIKILKIRDIKKFQKLNSMFAFYTELKEKNQ